MEVKDKKIPKTIFKQLIKWKYIDNDFAFSTID